MEITVNGQRRTVAEGATVADLLDEMKLDARRLAVERNRQLVRRAELGETPLVEGDQVEIVTLVGGG
jgi:thiamine biosynthesis protein ThiS